jgi:broad specificity phosphatase PhoE
MPLATRIVLLRHAHTANNGSPDPLLAGRTDLPLSERGRAELRQLQHRFRDQPPFDAIYSSPLQRAWSTAVALREIGLGTIRPCPALQEIDCGTLEGASTAEVGERHPALWRANLCQDDERFRWPGGESYRELRARTWRALHGVAIAHRGGRVALVTHAGVLSQIFGRLAGLSPARWNAFSTGSSSVSEIEWLHSSVTVVRLDDRLHLR